MSRIKIENYHEEAIENAGCNNGNYPSWTGQDTLGKAMAGMTCRCQKGCNGTDRIEFSGASVYLVEEDSK